MVSVSGMIIGYLANTFVTLFSYHITPLVVYVSLLGDMHVSKLAHWQLARFLNWHILGGLWSF